MIMDMGQEFEDANGELFPVAESGIYDARIVSVNEHFSGDRSKHPGSPNWKIVFSIEGGDADGIRVTTWQPLPFGDGTEWMEDQDRKKRINEIKRLWMATGAPSENGAVESDDLVDLQCRIDVLKKPMDENDPEGKQTNDLRDVLSLV